MLLIFRAQYSVDIAIPCSAGIGEPIYFYVETVFLWNGVSVGILFLFGTYLR